MAIEIIAHRHRALRRTRLCRRLPHRFRFRFFSDENPFMARFSTMTEVRRLAWPDYETPEWSAAQFLQGIAGTLELFHRSTLSFQGIARETTGHPVAVFQRIDQAGYKLPIDERILADADTLMVFGLDHIASEQEAAAEEIAAIREWLKREGTCLLLAPHHDVGFSPDLKQRQMEYRHHGDPLVPGQQRFGQYTRSLMKGLDVPVHNTYGLRPALVKATKRRKSPRLRLSKTSIASAFSRASLRSISTRICLTMN
jgi:hypothetical protein